MIDSMWRALLQGVPKEYNRIRCGFMHAAPIRTGRRSLLQELHVNYTKSSNESPRMGTECQVQVEHHLLRAESDRHCVEHNILIAGACSPILVRGIHDLQIPKLYNTSLTVSGAKRSAMLVLHVVTFAF